MIDTVQHMAAGAYALRWVLGFVAILTIGCVYVDTKDVRRG